eukprot:1788734-Karenia_brevis.AAC.1
MHRRKRRQRQIQGMSRMCRCQQHRLPRAVQGQEIRIKVTWHHQRHGQQQQQQLGKTPQVLETLHRGSSSSSSSSMN